MRRTLMVVGGAVIVLGCAGPSPYRRASALKDASTEAVVAALFDSEWKVAATAAQVLGRRNDDEASAALLQALAGHADWRVRAHAAAALGTHATQAVVAGLLEAASKDDHLGVREEAVGALGAMQSPNLAVVLVQFTLDPESTVRERATEALGGAKADDENLRAAALLASGKAGDPSAAIAFWNARIAKGGAVPPAVKAELDRLVAIDAEAKSASAKRNEEERVRAVARAEAEAKAQQEANQRAEATRLERLGQGNARLSRAYEFMRAGKLPDAISEAKEAASLGADTDAFQQEASALDWKRRGRNLTGDQLVQFISEWGENAPTPARSKFESEEAKRVEAQGRAKYRGSPLNANALRGLFGEQFMMLDAQPESVTDSEEKVRLLSDLLGCPTRDDGADDFEIVDCKKRAAELRNRKEPIYLQLRNSAHDRRYDFKRRGWILTFTDALQSGYGDSNVVLSVWKPFMPKRIEAQECEDGTWRCYQLQLPQTFKSLSIFVPMEEAEARAWRDAPKSGAPPEPGDGAILFLVSIRQGTQWSRSYTRWFIPEEAKHIRKHQGMLVRVHAMSLKLGARTLAFPGWWASP